jgi:hypothetical protein
MIDSRTLVVMAQSLMILSWHLHAHKQNMPILVEVKTGVLISLGHLHSQKDLMAFVHNMANTSSARIVGALRPSKIKTSGSQSRCTYRIGIDMVLTSLQKTHL